MKKFAVIVLGLIFLQSMYGCSSTAEIEKEIKLVANACYKVTGSSIQYVLSVSEDGSYEYKECYYKKVQGCSPVRRSKTNILRLTRVTLSEIPIRYCLELSKNELSYGELLDAARDEFNERSD